MRRPSSLKISTMAQSRLVSEFPITVWTGGTPPDPLCALLALERALISRLFREQCATLHSYWGDHRGLNKSQWETFRLFWQRARYDAHATLRAYYRNQPISAHAAIPSVNGGSHAH